MGHCIQALVTTPEVAGRLRLTWHGLKDVATRQGFVILPVDADFIDAAIEARVSRSTNAFKLLTDAFQEFLRELSQFGPVAYIETDYFGGHGGQGAAVYRDREVRMEPQWGRSGVINRALKRIGVKRNWIGDRFSALGLGAYRDNDDLIEAAG